jgi:hypothetical protein
MPPKSKEEENDEKDEKSIVKLMKSNLPKFSNEVDWEMAVFELGLVLDRIWPHKDELDIMDYMTSTTYRRSFYLFLVIWRIGQTALFTLHLPCRPRRIPTRRRRSWRHVTRTLFHAL